MRGGSGGAMRPAEPTVSPIGGVNSFETGPLGPSPLGVFNSLKTLGDALVQEPPTSAADESDSKSDSCRVPAKTCELHGALLRWSNR